MMIRLLASFTLYSCVVLSLGTREARSVLYENTEDTSGEITTKLIGYVDFSQASADDNIQITVSILTNTDIADGSHGFHIHGLGNVWGGCSSSGGHYNPLEEEHGAPSDVIRHVGDLGNIEIVDNAYTATFNDSKASLYGKHSILGRAVVLHEGVDDLGLGTGDLEETSKQTGNAGSRIACGVIGINSDGFDSGGVRLSAPSLLSLLMVMLQVLLSSCR